jgi:hypothetical protein
MSVPADDSRELSFDELLGQLLALLGREMRVAAGELAVSGRLASLPLEQAPAEIQRRAIERSLFGFTVGQDGAFWLERQRVRKVWEDRVEEGMLLNVDSDRGPLFISPLPPL